MAEEKTYVFGDTTGSNGMLSLLGPLMQNRGIDPSVLMAMKDDGFGGSSFIWVIFLFFLMGWGGNGFGGNGNGLANFMNNDFGRDMLLQAINGNGSAISQLASTLHCDVNAIQTAVNAVQSQVQAVGSQVGMSGQQIINAIQAGNCQIASQLANCCCSVKEAITKQGYENQLATEHQTAVLGSKLDAQTTLINDKFCQLEMREMQNKIDALREERSTLLGQISQEHQTQAIFAYQNQTIAPINAALNELHSDVDNIKCRLPETVSVPYSPVIGVPTCWAGQYGVGPYGYGYGYCGNNSYWG